jgi:hypothetical protein
MLPLRGAPPTRRSAAGEAKVAGSQSDAVGG